MEDLPLHCLSGKPMMFGSVLVRGTPCRGHRTDQVRIRKHGAVLESWFWDDDETVGLRVFPLCRDCKIAKNRLMTVREAMDGVLDEAFRRQSFGSIEHLFRREEIALAAYRKAAAERARLEHRWHAVRAALEYECDLMGVSPPAYRLRN